MTKVAFYFAILFCILNCNVNYTWKRNKNDVSWDLLISIFSLILQNPGHLVKEPQLLLATHRLRKWIGREQNQPGIYLDLLLPDSSSNHRDSENIEFISISKYHLSPSSGKLWFETIPRITMLIMEWSKDLQIKE